MRGWGLFAVAVLLAMPLSASVEETQLAERLASDATQFLDDLLGPGHARVLVSVHGDHTEVRTQSEVTTPIRKPSAPQEERDPSLMPGYVANSEFNAKKKQQQQESFDFVQRDQEQSLQTSGLIVKNLRVSVVLDTTLSEAQVNDVKRLLPEFLHLDGERGDVMAVLRAPLVPPWKRAFLDPEGIRTLVIFGGIVALCFWLGLIAYMAALSVVKTFVAEMAARRTAVPLPPMQGPPGLSLNAEILPAAGETPSLGGPDAEAEGGAQTPALLGRRFDYLSSREPGEMAELLAKETPQDLALLFGYLADSNPDLATRIFTALPQALQGEVSQSLMNMHMADPERLAMLENRLRTYVEYGVRGHDRLGQILSRLDPHERNEIMGDLMSRDSSGAQKVESSLFPFENIPDIPPAQLRRVIAAVPYQDWGVALRGASEEMVEKILSQIPAGPRVLVRDAMGVSQPREKIMEVRSKILSQVYSMAAKGEIVLKHEGSSTELI